MHIHARTTNVLAVLYSICIVPLWLKELKKTYSKLLVIHQYLLHVKVLQYFTIQMISGRAQISSNVILHWFLVCYHELLLLTLNVQGLPPAAAHVLPLPHPPVYPQPHRRHFRRRRRHFRRFAGRRPRPIALSISAPRPANAGYHLRHRIIGRIVAVSRRVARRGRGRHGGCAGAHAKLSERRVAAAAVWSAAALPYCGDHGDADAGYHCERSRCHLNCEDWKARQKTVTVFPGSKFSWYYCSRRNESKRKSSPLSQQEFYAHRLMFCMQRMLTCQICKDCKIMWRFQLFFDAKKSFRPSWVINRPFS